MCSGGSCKELRRRCDCVVATPRGGITDPSRVNRSVLARLGSSRALPFLSGNQQLSGGFGAGGANCGLTTAAALQKGETRAKQPAPQRSTPAPERPSPAKQRQNGRPRAKQRPNGRPRAKHQRLVRHPTRPGRIHPAGRPRLGPTRRRHRRPEKAMTATTVMGMIQANTMPATPASRSVPERGRAAATARETVRTRNKIAAAGSSGPVNMQIHRWLPMIGLGR